MLRIFCPVAESSLERYDLQCKETNGCEAAIKELPFILHGSVALTFVNTYRTYRVTLLHGGGVMARDNEDGGKEHTHPPTSPALCIVKLLPKFEEN